MTDNRVWVDSDGSESVACHRGDGLAIEVLHNLPLKIFILSTESNPVVSERARKLRVPCFQSISCKAEALRSLSEKQNFSLLHTLYVGNDLNDLLAMKLCGHRACPSDAHPEICAVSQVIMNAKGGEGAVRELVERRLGIDFIQMMGLSS